MEIRSLGLRTEVAMRRLAGSTVVDRGDHLVVRTPDNPSFWWGNFLVLRRAPVDETEARARVAAFEAEIPGVDHRAFAVDETAGVVEALEPLRTLVGGLAEASTVMTTRQVHPPPHPASDATLRPLATDADWAQQVELSMDGEHPAAYGLDFATRKARADRRLVDAGRGQWWGAFDGRGRLLSSMGLFGAGDGLARFQSVKTRPDARGRGLAGTLTHAVSTWGLDVLGAETLVMVADPSYLAIRVYRSVGFVDSETYVTLERTPVND